MEKFKYNYNYQTEAEIQADMLGYIRGRRDLEQQIKELDDIAYLCDIPHPTIPEYEELHQAIVKIRRFIHEEILKDGVLL